MLSRTENKTKVPDADLIESFLRCFNNVSSFLLGNIFVTKKLASHHDKLAVVTQKNVQGE